MGDEFLPKRNPDKNKKLLMINDIGILAFIMLKYSDFATFGESVSEKLVTIALSL